MQATADGEFYPEKDLDKNYRIPKRPTLPQSGGRNFNNASSTIANSQYNTSQGAAQTPLANSYYNYPYDPSAASAYYQNYSQYYQQYGQAYPTNDNSNYSNQRHNNANNQNRNSLGNSSLNFSASSNTSNPNNIYSRYRGYIKNNQNQYNKTPYYAGYNNYNTNANLIGGARNFNHPPPPPPPPSSGVEPIKQNIYNTLKDIKEKPKNYGNSFFQNTVPDLQDETLPKELKALFQPLYCKLCTAQLSSNQMAKMHYKSKNHEKQIRKWLIVYCEKTGEPLPKRAKASGEKTPEVADKNPTWFHCDVCDLDLTGRLHAESHYMGKAHQKAIMGWKAPAGQGHYDDSGKWVRSKTPKPKSFNFENGEDSFGSSFKREAVSQESTGSPPAKKKKEAQPPQKFHCDVCDINTTCQEQLDNHFRGQKHMKKLKQVGLNKYSEQRDLIEQTDTPLPLGYVPPTPSITESSRSISENELNLSVYRTPSGDYYCPNCNITSNSDAQFIQHMKSKNHAKKAAQKKSGSN